MIQNFEHTYFVDLMQKLNEIMKYEIDKDNGNWIV